MVSEGVPNLAEPGVTANDSSDSPGEPSSTSRNDGLRTRAMVSVTAAVLLTVAPLATAMFVGGAPAFTREDSTEDRLLELAADSLIWGVAFATVSLGLRLAVLIGLALGGSALHLEPVLRHRSGFRSAAAEPALIGLAFAVLGACVAISVAARDDTAAEIRSPTAAASPDAEGGAAEQTPSPLATLLASPTSAPP